MLFGGKYRKIKCKKVSLFAKMCLFSSNLLSLFVK